MSISEKDLTEKTAKASEEIGERVGIKGNEKAKIASVASEYVKRNFNSLNQIIEDESKKGDGESLADIDVERIIEQMPGLTRQQREAAKKVCDPFSQIAKNKGKMPNYVLILNKKVKIIDSINRPLTNALYLHIPELVTREIVNKDGMKMLMYYSKEETCKDANVKALNLLGMEVRSKVILSRMDTGDITVGDLKFDTTKITNVYTNEQRDNDKKEKPETTTKSNRGRRGRR